MSRRSKIIIAVIIFILLLLALAYFLLQPKISVVTGENSVDLINSTRSGGLNATTGTNINRGTNQPAANVNAAPVTTPPPPPDDRTSLRRLAASFAERFGSFSNQGNYDNILELETFMTVRMTNWADGYVAEQRKKPASPAFFGVTTRAISTNLVSFDDSAGTATITVTTQRSEQRGSGPEKVYYQDITLEFLKEGDVWKVDSAIWKPQ